MADAEKGKTREEEEYVPADYVAPAGADEHAKGGGRWSQVCDWPLAFREALVALFFLALVDSGSRLAVLKAVLG